MSELNEFQKFHNEMRRLTNPRMFYPSVDENGRRTPPYIRPKRDGEIKGKLNIRIAKRARIKLLKESQCQNN
jgi:hypothetical protein